MKRLFFLIAIMALAAISSFAQESTKKERNFIRHGNSLYNSKHYADAEIQYRKALEENPASEVGLFNLASSLLRQSGAADPNKGNNPVDEAKRIMTNLSQGAQNPQVKELSFYNLGNLAFNAQDYQQSIVLYKNALRVNPDNDKTRQNLRLAQLRLKEQQQDKDKDKNKDKDNKDQQDNKDQNKDNKDKNKDDKDQNKDKKDEQKQDQEQNQPQEKKDDDKQRQQQNQNGISEQNAEQILKALDNQEKATRQRVNAQMKKAEQSSRSRSRHKW